MIQGCGALTAYNRSLIGTSLSLSGVSDPYEDLRIAITAVTCVASDESAMTSSSRFLQAP